MMLAERLQTKTPLFSFEFFPPKTPQGELSLFRAVESVRDLGADFVSITSGAGGSGRRETTEWARKIESEMGLTALVHLTSRGLSRDQLEAGLEELRENKLLNILALRGDSGVSIDGGLEYASDLIRLIRQRLPQASIGAACYPEGHVESTSKNADLDHLKRKVDEGADFLITQLFFDNNHYFEFVGRARSKGITQPIIPGIMPIQNVQQVTRFTEMCGATMPDHLRKLLEQYQESKQATFYIGVAHAIAQSHELLASGSPGVHFYTLNKSPATKLVVEALRKG